MRAAGRVEEFVTEYEEKQAERRQKEREEQERYVRSQQNYYEKLYKQAQSQQNAAGHRYPGQQQQNYQKGLQDFTGRPVPDDASPNWWTKLSESIQKTDKDREL